MATLCTTGHLLATGYWLILLAMHCWLSWRSAHTFFSFNSTRRQTCFLIILRIPCSFSHYYPFRSFFAIRPLRQSLLCQSEKQSFLFLAPVLLFSLLASCSHTPTNNYAPEIYIYTLLTAYTISLAARLIPNLISPQPASFFLFVRSTPLISSAIRMFPNELT